MLRIKPISLRQANAFVSEHHRHNTPTNGHKFSIAVYDDEHLCGVAICGRPIARMLDDGETIEASRVCTDGTRNACSALYGACARIAKEFGYKRIVTYILETESGISLKASGWKMISKSRGREWGTPSRPRSATEMTLFGEQVKYPTCNKIRWEKQLRKEKDE